MADFQPTARVIADSISPHGHRLTTIEATIHRFVLAELNTHRRFSRNSASSRAIPVARTMARVADTPAVPLSWPSERAGMQGGGDLPDDVAARARAGWLAARDAAVTHAEHLTTLGVHKSVTNRLLEPFLTHTVIVSATDWDGFWAQRLSPLAQPEIRAAAEAMRAAYDASTPQTVYAGEWHLPYITDADRDDLTADVLRKVSAARCARVSYLTHDGQRDHRADVDLYHRLVAADPPHASPLEHVATPLASSLAHQWTPSNFTGWLQLRHLTLGA